MKRCSFSSYKIVEMFGNRIRQMRHNVLTASNSFLTSKQELKHVIRKDLIQYLSYLVDKTKPATDLSSITDYRP